MHTHLYVYRCVHLLDASVLAQVLGYVGRCGLLTFWQKLHPVSRLTLTSEGMRRSTLNLAEWWIMKKIEEADPRGNYMSSFLFSCEMWHGNWHVVWVTISISSFIRSRPSLQFCWNAFLGMLLDLMHVTIEMVWHYLSQGIIKILLFHYVILLMGI